MLYKEVKQVLETNKAQRHIRGGMATRMKYQKEAASRLSERAEVERDGG